MGQLHYAGHKKLQPGTFLSTKIMICKENNSTNKDNNTNVNNITPTDMNNTKQLYTYTYQCKSSSILQYRIPPSSVKNSDESNIPVTSSTPQEVVIQVSSLNRHKTTPSHQHTHGEKNCNINTTNRSLLAQLLTSNLKKLYEHTMHIHMEICAKRKDKNHRHPSYATPDTQYFISSLNTLGSSITHHAKVKNITQQQECPYGKHIMYENTDAKTPQIRNGYSGMADNINYDTTKSADRMKSSGLNINLATDAHISYSKKDDSPTNSVDNKNTYVKYFTFDQQTTKTAIKNIHLPPDFSRTTGTYGNTQSLTSSNTNTCASNTVPRMCCYIIWQFKTCLGL